MKRLISWLLALTLVFGLLPLSAFAVENDVDVNNGDSDFDVEFGGELNPITVEWTWNEEYTEATASVTVPAGKTFSYQFDGGDPDMIMTANGVAVEWEVGSRFMRTPSTFELTNATGAEVIYELKLSYPVGAYNTPEVIENIDGYTDTNTISEGYYYIWTATEDGTVTLAVTDGANIVVDNQTTYKQFNLAEADWENKVWNVAENLQIPVKAGESIKIQVVGLMDFETYTDPESTTYTLTGDFQGEAIVVPEGTLTDTGRTLNLQGVIYVNQYFKVSGYGDLTTDYIVQNSGLLTWKEAVTDDVAVLGYGNPDVNTDIAVVGGEFVVMTDGIASAEYATEMYMRVYLLLPNGEYVYTPVKEYSVQMYCENQLNKASAKPTLKTLCAYMLHYGAAAQVNFGINTGDLANKNVPLDTYPINTYSANLIDPVDTFTTSLIASNKVIPNGKTLSLDGAIKVNYYYLVNGFTPVKAELLTWEGVTGELTDSNCSKRFDLTLVGNEYYASGREIAAPEYGDTIFACARFEDAEGNVYYSEISGYHPEYYAQNQINKNQKPNLVALCKAIVVYGEAAVAHFG